MVRHPVALAKVKPFTSTHLGVFTPQGTIGYTRLDFLHLFGLICVKTWSEELEPLYQIYRSNIQKRSFQSSRSFPVHSFDRVIACFSQRTIDIPARSVPLPKYPLGFGSNDCCRTGRKMALQFDQHPATSPTTQATPYPSPPLQQM